MTRVGEKKNVNWFWCGKLKGRDRMENIYTIRD
jgi:hypothetical protein